MHAGTAKRRRDVAGGAVAGHQLAPRRRRHRTDRPDHVALPRDDQLIDRRIAAFPPLTPETTMLRRLTSRWLVVAVLAFGPLPAIGAEPVFPFGSELLLDEKPMRGTKRLPSLSIERDGTAAIDLW